MRHLLKQRTLLTAELKRASSSAAEKLQQELTDVKAGDGGFCVIRGSHKINYPVPQEIVHGEAYTDRLYQPETEAGDVVLFSEATVHGTLPWTSHEERRAVL